MTSPVLSTLSNNLANQENVTSRLLGKTATTHNKLQPGRRLALDDLGNRIHNLQHGNETNKNSVMGPPVATARDKIHGVKKRTELSAILKDKAATKENTSQVSNNILPKKPVRQESIVISKGTSQGDKKITAVVKQKITEQTKDLTIYDPDEKTRDDPQLVTEYVEDILTYLRNIENEYPIKEKFLEEAKVTPKMRSTLVNWLVQAHANFSLGVEALYLAISIVDRYLQVNKGIDRSTFQLLGTAALLLAAKYEEVYIPDINDFVYICDGAFTKRQLLKMEIDICKRLEFRMGWPVSIYFLRRYSKIAAVRSDQHTLAKYILELALVEYPLAHVKPSIQAAAACCLAVAILSETMEPSKVWSVTLVHYTKYKYSDIKPVVHEFAHMIVRAETTKFTSVRLKYCVSKFGKMSLNCKLRGPLIRKLTLPPTLNRK